ncbi:hypothetical protein SDC9_204545 [bioreactor metagenome]|uniref:Uncharacterized protein n=1 Tax=bioreactor metagenome TaxID=1076179 RepID=A0A645J171_9ZZZZ
MKVRGAGDQTVHFGQLHAGVLQSLQRQVGHLFQMEHARRRCVLLRLVLRDANQRRFSLQTHMSPLPRKCAFIV